MPYESQFERFEAASPAGRRVAVEFLRAGFLTAGDQPELYFFRVSGEEVAVGMSGQSLRRFQQGRRSLSREEKIDLAGLLLKRQIESGVALESKNLFVRDEELAQLASDLGFPL